MAKRKVYPKPTELAKKLLKLTASQDYDVARKAMHALAQGLEEPLRQGILEEGTLADIYAEIELEGGAESKFSLDFIAPGTEGDFVAFTIPDQARIPQRHVEGSEIWVPTFRVANSIDWSLSYARDARWDVVSRATEVLAEGITERLNDDGWHVILASAASRGIVVQDDAAVAGEFTRRLANRLKTVNKRVAPGPGFTITDLYMSPEAFEDIREWDNTEVDELTRREIFTDVDGGLAGIYGIRLHELKKLGVGQAYQDFITTNLGVAVPSGDEEFVVALDLTRRDSFVEPIRSRVEVFEDQWLHREQKAGLYAWTERGFAALDNRRALFGSF